MQFASVNPHSGETIATYPLHSKPDQGRLYSLSEAAFQKWRNFEISKRSELLRGIAGRLRQRALSLAELMADEMGKPLRDGLAEIEKCAWVCDYYADHGPTFLLERPVSTEASSSAVLFEPLGPILSVMPWNFPFWQTFRFAAPALMAGNSILLKHAPNVPGCGIATEELFEDAGGPTGLLINLRLDNDGVAAAIAGRTVRAITLTGSTRAGRAVAQAAGANLKKCVLELGGSDPYLILADAEMTDAVQQCVQSRLINAGQSCIAAKRFIVVAERYAEFCQSFVKEMATKTMGDPKSDQHPDLGPLARSDLRAALHEQVEASISRGARLLLGGKLPKGPGNYYPPTVLADVTPGMPVFDQETFGPVAALIKAKDEQDAIRLANQSCYGLGAAIFSANTQRALQIARKELEAGACFVNSFVRSDPRLPFGGIKESGFGRELGEFGILEFVNVKTTYAQ